MTIAAAFTDFFLAQDSTFVNDASKLKEAVSYRTTLLKRLLAHKTAKQMYGGGSDIRSRIQLLDNGQTHFWGIDDTESPSQPQVVSEIVSPWAFMRTPIVWDEPTILLNNSRVSGKERRIAMYDLKQQLNQQAVIDAGKFIEESIWAAPTTAMETHVSGGPTYSLSCFVSEKANALPTGFTTVETINPATSTNWQNQIQSYTGSTAESSTGDLLYGLSRMSRLVHFEGLPLSGEMGQKETMPAAVYCSISGITLLEQAMRASQDAFVYVGRQDPTYPKPTIHGVPVEWLDILSTANYVPTGAADAYATEATTTSTTHFMGPRYTFLNFEDLNIFFHTDMFMHKHPPMSWPGQPTRKVVYCDTFLNLICTNRRTQGVVAPLVDDVDAAYL